MKKISWNVNGIKSTYGNRDYLKTLVKKRNREKYNPYFLTVIFLLTASLP